MKDNLIKKIGWPFKRYCILIPKKMNFDVFEWLYINLVIFQNQSDGNDVSLYNEEVVSKVIKIIKENFPKIIDEKILESILDTISKQYTYTENKVIKLNEKAFEYLNAYENLFSDNLSIKYFYQDQICGEVFPYFYDSIEIDELTIKNFREECVKSIELNKPSKKQIFEAYKQFIKMQNTSNEKSLVDEENDKDESDYEKNDINYTIIYLNQPSEIEYFEVCLFIDDGEIKCISPFDNYSNLLMNKLLNIGRSISQNINESLNDIESKYLPNEKIKMKFSGSDDFASSLKYFGEIFRLIDYINNNELREYIKNLDKSFIIKSDDFYTYGGKYLERLAKLVDYEKTIKDIRKNTNQFIMQKEIDNKLLLSGTKARLNLSNNLFNNWKNDTKDFSGYFVDIIYKSRIIYSPHMYDKFINDVFEIYNNRNWFGAHDSNNNRKIELEDIEQIKKVTKVFIDVIKEVKDGKEK